MEKNLLRGDKHELRNCLCINQKKERDVDPDWWHRISLDQPTFPIQLQETLLNDCLLEKDKPLLSSTIQRIWHPLLKS